MSGTIFQFKFINEILKIVSQIKEKTNTTKNL